MTSWFVVIVDSTHGSTPYGWAVARRRLRRPDRPAVEHGLLRALLQVVRLRLDQVALWAPRVCTAALVRASVSCAGCGKILTRTCLLQRQCAEPWHLPSHARWQHRQTPRVCQVLCTAVAVSGCLHAMAAGQRSAHHR